MTRVAVIDKELCKKQDCPYQCIPVCPINKIGDPCIIVDEETKFPIIDENLCIGCGLCIKRCDNLNYHAISIVNLPEQLKEKPIHRFGINDFILYRLPYPIKDSIVGIVGSNGLGKTTALRILTGEIKPNMGDPKKEFSVDDMISLFRGTELQSYLKKLQEGEIRVSYKLQRADKIPTYYSGKVSKLLDKVDERGILNELIFRFNIEDIMEKNIKEISGGELQRTAIAATLAKNADIYYFDEPTSFLDVFQRLEVSKAIQEFSKGKSVIVVDHDIATLDFLVDRVHIFYGVPGVYGIVSQPYSVRVGINAFLDGFLKEENMRIRKEPIMFESTFIESEMSEDLVVEFNDIRKKLGEFSMYVENGKVYTREVLGILGANALGKTTFVRILAGEIEKDHGSISGKVKISYKSQYPHTDFDGTVLELLSSVAKDVLSDTYKAEILRPLELDRFLEKRVKNLSGGELQRLAIALSLSKQADVYLFDEPSAFLDVEQRLALAKTIRRIVEKREAAAMVVDHDLLFLSQISDRAMVFFGEGGRDSKASEPKDVKQALNEFLKSVNVTFRRDPHTGRPRANKLNSQLDREQKEVGKYFY